MEMDWARAVAGPPVYFLGNHNLSKKQRRDMQREGNVLSREFFPGSRQQILELTDGRSRVAVFSSLDASWRRKSYLHYFFFFRFRHLFHLLDLVVGELLDLFQGGGFVVFG